MVSRVKKIERAEKSTLLPDKDAYIYSEDYIELISEAEIELRQSKAEFRKELALIGITLFPG